jgi:hypothetical protein
MEMMARYDIRNDGPLDRSTFDVWTIYDIWTGVPVVVAGFELMDWSMEDAENLMKVLNLIHARRQAQSQEKR